MKKNFLFFSVLVMALGWLAFILTLLPRSSQAANAQDVVINEIAWMGSSSYTADEWIELKNLTDVEIDLSGWALTAEDGAPTIALTGVIPAQGYYLLERTDDTSVPGVLADLIYSGALEDGGENLTLSDQSANLIDSLDASAGWPAGDSGANLTMERTDQGLWQNSFIIDGTPKAANSQAGNDDNPICGNGETETDEQCDDGINNGAVCLPAYGSSCDFCSDSCQTVTVVGPFCGDTIVNGQEQCDDGNTAAGDGCDEQCLLETESPLCGDNIVDENEQCDNGVDNGLACQPDYSSSCDYCSDSCQLETVNGPFCGDNLINGDEQCDDGNALAGDGCDEQCLIEAEDNNGARGYKLAALELTNNLKNDQSGLNRLINETAKLIEQSLTEQYWLDQNQLEPSQGHQVFNYEIRAINKINLILRLSSILRLANLSQAAADDLKQVIDDLAQADKMVAETAFSQASEALSGSDNNRNGKQRLISRAENIMDLAVTAMPANPRLAVLYFSQVWWLSQRVMN